MPNDVLEYLKLFSQERYRAIFLHADPTQSLLVTNFAKKICTATSGKYLDLLNLFIETKELNQKIDSFSPEDFRKLLIGQSNDVSLIMVDRVDFLIDTWRRQQRNDLFRSFSDQWDGFKDGMNAMVVLCIQTPLDINDHKISDSQGRSRIFHISDFNDI